VADLLAALPVAGAVVVAGAVARAGDIVAGVPDHGEHLGRSKKNIEKKFSFFLSNK
jgi:hypothetical protein